HTASGAWPSRSLLRNSSSMAPVWASAMAPLAVWFDDSDPEALRKSFAGADVQALVNLQHLQNGPARRAEFLALDVPVLQTLGYRDGNEADW
ncbi:hypothetical protein, partial [Pseudomonas aeruginosa]|uniref:hypothetical protein n=1 Tax=Pseudomonas aeruginosa TaxID=287 RepID=UPI0024B653F4